MSSKKVVLSADGTTATVTDAVLSDVLTTAISTSEAVTGSYGLFQKGLILFAGMAIQEQRRSGNWNPL